MAKQEYMPNLSIPNIKDARKTIRAFVPNIIRDLRAKQNNRGFFSRIYHKFRDVVKCDLLGATRKIKSYKYVIPVEGIYMQDEGAVDALIKLVVSMLLSCPELSKKYKYSVYAKRGLPSMDKGIMLESIVVRIFPVE